MQIEGASKLLDVPDEEVFNIRKMKVEIPDCALIYAILKYFVCGENIMEPATE